MYDRQNAEVTLLSRWGSWAASHWGASLLIALVITVVMGIGVSLVRAEFTFYSIMPEASTQVRDLRTIVETFPAASSIVVVVEAVDKGNEAASIVKRAIDALTAELSSQRYSRYVSTVQSRIDTAFILDHGLMLSEVEDIRRLKDLYAGLDLASLLAALNDDLEREYGGDEARLTEDEEQVTILFEGLADILDLMESASRGEMPSESKIRAAVVRFLAGDGYLMNGDGTMGILLVHPAFTINDLEPLMRGVPMIEEAVKSAAPDLGVRAGLTGLTVVAKDEGVTAQQGLAVSTSIAILLILALMILTFRMFSVPFITGVPLIIGVVWTIGVAGYGIQRLNILSAMYVVALLGLGIDYAIHLLTTFVQERDNGADFVQAVSLSFAKSGSGILIGAVTTSVAFFALMVAQSQVVKELGFIAGAGILCELCAMFILIPALLGLRNWRMERKGRRENPVFHRFSLRSTLLPGLGKTVKRVPVIFALLSFAAGAALTTQAFKVEIEGNLMNMEAKGLESIELQDRMVEEFGMAPDFLSLTGGDLDEHRRLAKDLENLSLVKSVDSLTAYLPSESEQAERRPHITDFADALSQRAIPEEINSAALAEEIERLSFNLIELSDLAFLGGMDRLLHTLNRITGFGEQGEKVRETPLDRLPGSLTTGVIDTEALADYQSLLGNGLKDTLLRMSATESITIPMLPEMIRNSYVSRDGKLYLTNILPVRNPWDADFRRDFTTQVSSVTEKATGMILAADQMFQIARVDGVRAAITALAVIFLLLLVDLRNLKLVVVTLLPLILAFGSLFGIMALLRIKFDFINIICVPLLIGIGVDDAVHINHRYLLEGAGHMDGVIAKTGTAILMTTVTTMIGFASFIPSPMRAMRSTGIILPIAMALAFLFSILFHPAVLVILSEKLGLSIRPWRLHR